MNKPEAETECGAGELRAQMQSIRQQLPADMEEIVSGARRLTDWRRGVSEHPWVAMATAAMVGYFVVPAKTPSLPADADSETLARLVREQKLRLEPRSKPGGGLFNMLVSTAGGLALKAGSAYLQQQLLQRSACQTSPGQQEPVR